jgi:hypothetical protein
MRLPVIRIPALLAVFKRAVALSARRALHARDMESRKAQAQLIAAHQQQQLMLRNKHETEVLDMERRHREHEERMREEFEIRYKRLAETYFLTNQDAKELTDRYNDAMSQINSWENLVTDVMSQQKRRDALFQTALEDLVELAIPYLHDSRQEAEEYERASLRIRKKIEKAVQKPRKLTLAAILKRGTTKGETTT